MEVEFILTVKSTCFFLKKNHHFYVESVAPIFIMDVQSQIPINKDEIIEMVLLFFRHMAEGFVKKLYRTVDVVKYIFALPVESVAPC